jgi:hypothetical protein
VKRLEKSKNLLGEVAPFLSNKTNPQVPLASKGNYSQVGFAYEGRGKKKLKGRG